MLHFQILMLGADWMIVSASFLLAYRLRHLGHFPIPGEMASLLNPFELGRTISFEAFRPYYDLFLIAPIIRILWLRSAKVYNLKGEFSILDDLIAILKATTMASLVLIVIAFMYRGFFEFRQYSYSRGVFLIDWVIALVGLCAIHSAVRAVQILLRQRSLNMIPSVVVGEGELAELCLSEIAAKPQLGYKVVGVVSSKNAPIASKTVGYTIGQLGDLPQIVKRLSVETVFITDPEMNPDVLFETILKSWRSNRVRFNVVPSLLNCLPSKTGIDQIGTLPMITLFQEPLRGPNRYIKRAFDILASTLGLLILSPLFAMVALVIKLDSRGPALFRQERVGMDGRVFLAYKFRTMRTGADEKPHREIMAGLIKGSPDRQADVALASATVRPLVALSEVLYGKVPEDERITRLGRWLRRWSLDELPQLINVLKGEMSIVGPRPPIPYEVENYSSWHRKRLEVKPGITGLWQVSGRNRLPFEQMVQLDVYYIENWSLWLDFKIILKTIPAIVRGETV